ncbi:MAG TPA: hypothetical protein VLB80_03915 [Candidatus Babeliales bacterium]|nr:hypothetical protein [Candidatus Babeliales bacterium]
MSRLNMLLLTLLVPSMALLGMKNEFKNTIAITPYSQALVDDIKKQSAATFIPDPLYDVRRDLSKFGKLSINDSRKNPKEVLPNSIKFIKKNFGKNEEILKTLEVFNALINTKPKSQKEKDFFEIIQLHDRNAQKKFLKMPLGGALISHNIVNNFITNRKDFINKENKETSINYLFKMSSPQINELDKLNKHFINDVVLKDVTRQEYDLIASLPKNVKRAFRNEDEFFQVNLKRNLSEKLLYLATKASIGGINGSGTGFITALGSGMFQCKFLIPGIEKWVAKTLTTEVNKKINYGLELISMTPVVPNGESNYDEWKQVENKFNNTLNKIYDIDGVKAQFTGENLKPYIIKEVITGGSPVAPNDMQTVIGDSIGSSKFFGGLSAIVGLIYGLRHMNDPIVKENISKI